ncbi:MAG TPA: D-tyrosyl-tRNA(Tyr) deacylase [Clostridia bacterium]|jgi:D-tyrosyl-tRNA(Tyr) deacylase|nr:D-aminoacyl-tRNA deacylase [Clostridia bacterium]HHY06878.1 D-tyrosyl-tRNA(Tyr) deacylase [Clostridia bacterium]
MRAVVQRVQAGAVLIEGETVSRIKDGLVVFLGVGQNDEEKDVQYLAKKIINLRIFEDEAGKLNLSLLERGGEILVVSQFTLYGDCRQGRRPSFTAAAAPEKANFLYQLFVEKVKEEGVTVATGVFQAEMLVKIENDGPVTLLLDSKKLF